MTRWMTWLIVLSVWTGMLLCPGWTGRSTVLAAEGECGKDADGDFNLLTVSHSWGELVPDTLEEKAPGAVTLVASENSQDAYVRIDVCVPEIEEEAEEREEGDGGNDDDDEEGGDEGDKGNEDEDEADGEDEEDETSGVSLSITNGADGIELSKTPGGEPLAPEELNFSSATTLWMKATEASGQAGDIRLCASFMEDCEDTVNATSVRIEWIDNTPDYARDPGEYQNGVYIDDGDSDNFFLRHVVRPRKKNGEPDYAFPGEPDYVDLDLWYRILPQDLADYDVVRAVNIHMYEGEGDSLEPALEGERADEAWKTGDALYVVWDGRQIRASEDAEFNVVGVYRLQLAVSLGTDKSAITFRTPIDDGDSELPGWQCPQNGLAIHDLAFKHRPDLYVGSGEKVAPNGPVHPFKDIESHYRLVKGDNHPAWEQEDDDDENYYYFGSFPTTAQPITDSSYPVLQASVERDPPETETQSYMMLTDDSLACLESSGIHPEVLRYIGQLKDGKFASEDELIEAVKDVLFTGYLDEYEALILGCAEWREDETRSGGALAHYLDIHDPQTLAVLTAQSFERLRQEDSIPENLLSCLEGEFLDREISIPWHQNELIRRVGAYLQEGCGLADNEQAEHYADAAWKTAKIRKKHEHRNCEDGDPYLLHRGHVYDGTENTHLNHVFIQYWMYSTASYAPFNSSGVLSHAFWHEADWEMVQIALRLSNPEFPEKKSDWLLPYAATASQHYHGQTLAWRLDRSEEPDPENYDQDYVSTTEDGQRIHIYVAEDAHATYFRPGAIMSPTESAVGTQYQYLRKKEVDDVAKAWDFISAPKNIFMYKLLPLEALEGKGLYDWFGKWGEPDPSGLSGPNVESPNARHVNDTTHKDGHFKMDAAPARFHERCRKIINGDADEKTDLLPK